MTPKRLKVLAFIAHYQAEHGFAPTYLEIAAGTGVRSAASIAVYVGVLVAREWLSREDHHPRGLNVTERGLRILAGHKPCPVCALRGEA